MKAKPDSWIGQPCYRLERYPTGLPCSTSAWETLEGRGYRAAKAAQTSPNEFDVQMVFGRALGHGGAQSGYQACIKDEREGITYGSDECAMSVVDVE